MTQPNASEPRAMTTAGLQAKVELRGAWFATHPHQPIPESRAQVESLFADIEREAATPPPALDVERLADLLSELHARQIGVCDWSHREDAEWLAVRLSEEPR